MYLCVGTHQPRTLQIAMVTRGLESFVILILLLACSRIVGSAPSLFVTWDANNPTRFNVSLDGVLFAHGSGPTSVLGRPPRRTNVFNSTGQDTLGIYNERRAMYHASDSITFETAVRVYSDQRTVMFEQRWPSGVD